MTAKEISELPGMPGTTQGVHKKAKRDGWSYRKQEGVKGPGVEYLVSVLDEGGYINQVQDTTLVYRNQFPEDSVSIPGYMVQVSAGHGAQGDGVTEECERQPVSRRWLRRRGFNEKELAIVWSKGDSMEPTISNNDTLVVHLGRTRPVDGHIYVVRNDDQLWVKRLQVRPSAWLLLSDNSHYPPIEVPKDEQHTFEVIGQVVRISHDVGE